ncbi:MAG: protein kinase, partial [Crocosphaera sp.]
LVYLQEERIPSIFHQDIKPENILVDNNNKAYLIDFGLARIGTNTMALSSMMGGTMGFMPPEQIRNLKPSQASDLYSLGATLICLITQTESINIGNLVDFDSNKFNFREKVTKFSNRFIQWLEKMVEPNPANRYQNARKALEALTPLDVIRVPKVTFYGGDLNFVASKIGEKITKEIEFFNEVTDTILEGFWSVKPHQSDPPHSRDNHAWIKFSPQTIKVNRGICQITVDTGQLQANQYFKREIVFISNAEYEVYALDLTVKTAIPQLNIRFPPYLSIFSTTLMVAVISGLLVKGGIWLATKLNIEQWNINLENLIYSQYNYLILLLFLFIGLGVFVEKKLDKQGVLIKIIIALFFPIPGLGFGMILAMLWRVLENLIIKPFVKNFSKKDYKNWVITLFLIPVIAVGILLGISTVIGFTPWLIKALIASSTPLVGMLLSSPIQLITLKDKYRQLESKNLIES